MKKLERTEYMDKLLAFRDKQLIKVVTGVRRCGKSTLLELFRDRLRSEGVEERQIVSVNLEDYDFLPLRDPAALHAYIKERIVPDAATYVFLDEVQHCRDFPAVVDSLALRPGVDLYLTGSNAFMLSGELATLLSGRYVEIRMLPLSFREFVLAAEGGDLPALYRAYVESSSFPYALELRDRPGALRDYLEGLYNTIVVKDIAARKTITDTMMLESVTRFVFDSVGSPLSPKKISDTLTSEGRKIDVRTVERYLSGLTESFIVYQAKRYNVRGKQHLKTLEKYYAVDVGLRRHLLGRGAADVGHILENVVFLELLRRGYEVSVGKVGELEVDFVAWDDFGLRYVQVAATVRDESVLRRELAPLRAIDDHHPKLLLTLDDDPPADYDGIRRLNALDWLIGRVER